MWQAFSFTFALPKNTTQMKLNELTSPTALTTAHDWIIYVHMAILNFCERTDNHGWETYDTSRIRFHLGPALGNTPYAPFSSKHEKLYQGILSINYHVGWRRFVYFQLTDLFSSAARASALLRIPIQQVSPVLTVCALQALAYSLHIQPAVLNRRGPSLYTLRHRRRCPPM